MKKRVRLSRFAFQAASLRRGKSKQVVNVTGMHVSSDRCIIMAAFFILRANSVTPALSSLFIVSTAMCSLNCNQSAKHASSQVNATRPQQHKQGWKSA